MSTLPERLDNGGEAVTATSTARHAWHPVIETEDTVLTTPRDTDRLHAFALVDPATTGITRWKLATPPQ